MATAPALPRPRGGASSRRPAAPARAAGPWPALGLGALVFLTALAARLFRHAESYEVHVDEASYADVAGSLLRGDGLTIFGGPFHLHPPGQFLVLALVQRLTGLDGDPIPVILALRPVAAVAGALTCVVVALLLRRLAGTLAGAVGGLALAADPFANRWDSRLFLEAPAMLMSATAISCLVAVSTTSRPRGRLLVGAGLATGLAVLVKEPFALITALPLALLLATGWVLRRRDSATVLGVAGLCYLGYVTGVVATGQWSPWWREKGSGVRRLLGTEQVTGYNAPGAESVGSRLVERFVDFGPTYLVMALGGLSAVVLLWWAAPWRRRAEGRAGLRTNPVTVVALWALIADGYIAYAITLGTLEEQAFYVVLAPAVTTTVLLLSRVLTWRHPRLTAAAVALVVVLLAAQATSWVLVHTRSDDGYRELAAWASAELPPGTRVAVTEDTAQFLLRGVDLTGASTLPALRAGRVDHVLVSTSLAARGYGTADAALVQQLARDAPVVFSHRGPTLGDLRLHDVRALTGGSGAGASGAVGSGAAPAPPATSG